MLLRSPPVCVPLRGARTRCGAGALSDAGTQRLLDWARANQLKHAQLQPATFQLGLRGLSASRNIAAGDAVATVPHKAVLEVTSRAVSPPTGLADQAAYLASPWWARLALLLLREKAQAGESRWAAYVQCLPAALPVPLRWTDAQISALGAPALASRIAQQRGELEAAHARLQASGEGTLAGGVSLAEFTWAVECVRSRTFSGPYEGSDATERQQQLAFILALTAVFVVTGAGPAENALSGALSALCFVVLKDLVTQALPSAPRRYVLCPVVDLCNHRSEAVSELAYEYFQNSFSLLTGDFQAGEQVFVSYGALSNDELLQYYGFVEADNPHDLLALDAASQLTKTALSAAGVSAAMLECKDGADAVRALQNGIQISPTGAVTPPEAAVALRTLAGGTDQGMASLTAGFVKAAWPPSQLEAAQRAVVDESARAARLREADEPRMLALQYRAAKHGTAAQALRALSA